MGRSPWRFTFTATVLALALAGCSIAGFPRIALIPPPTTVPSATATPVPESPTPPPAPEPNPVPPTPVPATTVPATLTPPQPPSAPNGVRYRVRHTPAGNSPGTDTYTISWTAPRAPGVEIRVLGLTKCLSNVMDQPCVQRHMTIPQGTLKQIERAASSKGSISWTWPTSEVSGDWVGMDESNTYYAFLVGAYNAAGQSRLIIAKSAKACPGCVY